MQINQCKRRCSVENVWQIENSHQCSKEIILTADKCILASNVVDAGFSCQKLYLTAMISTIQYKETLQMFFKQNLMSWYFNVKIRKQLQSD